MDIPEHVIDGETRLHVIVGDPIAQVKSPSALTPMLLARGHNSIVACVITAPALSPVVRVARDAGCATSTGGQMHAAQQQMLVDFMLGS